MATRVTHRIPTLGLAVAVAMLLPTDLHAQRVGWTRRLIDTAGSAIAGAARSVVQFAGSSIESTPTLHDPLTAVGACADLITFCYNPALPGGGIPAPRPIESLDQCIAVTRQCQTMEPWREQQCCPVACTTAYQAARRAGRSPLDAFQQVYFLQPDCFPGVRAMVGEQP